MREVADPKERFLAACADAKAGDARRMLQRSPGVVAELTPEEQRVLPDAAWAGNAAAVALMLELGFDPATPGQDGGTALHCGAWEGCVDCVAAALGEPRARALVNQPDPTYGSTPLGWCCHGACHAGKPAKGYVEIARLLLEAGARPEPGIEDAAPAEVQAVIRKYRRADGEGE